MFFTNDVSYKFFTLSFSTRSKVEYFCCDVQLEDDKYNIV